MIRQLKNINFWTILAMDAVMLGAAHLLAYAIRFEGSVPADHFRNMLVVLPWVIPGKIFVFYFFGLYQGMWRYSSITDMMEVLKASVLVTTGVISAIVFLNRFQGFSRSVFILDGLFTFIFISGNRLTIRLLYQRLFNKSGLVNKGKKISRKKILIVGAGDAGEKVLREVIDNQSLPYRILGFLDDDLNKQGRRIHGVPVLGGTEDIQIAAEKTGAKELVIAMPSASKEQIANVVDLCRQSGLPYKTLPGLGELITDDVSIRTIREVSYKDLLGRSQVNLESDKISKIIKDKVIFVTGAGGTIGSELSRQLLRFGPGLLILMDCSEENLYRLEMEVVHDFHFDRYVTVLGKVQDIELLESIFEQYKPEVVFHAAAYKHVPMVEKNPWEAVYNNVFASHRLIQAAKKYGAERFVLVSTDKAVRPTNVMGASKRLTEILMLAHGVDSKTMFMAVRFGNVLGSSGSVIPLFKRQVEKGGPVTVTHPEITRYFMSIDEAAQLILQAGAMGKGGEIFILKMGTPVRIAQMARDFIRLCGKEPDVEIEIKYIGLRPGEKLYEELITDGEGIVPTQHEKIMVLKGEPRSIDDLRAGLDSLKKYSSEHDARKIKDTLRNMVPEYKPCDAEAVLKVENRGTK